MIVLFAGARRGETELQAGHRPLELSFFQEHALYLAGVAVLGYHVILTNLNDLPLVHPGSGLDSAALSSVVS